MALLRPCFIPNHFLTVRSDALTPALRTSCTGGEQNCSCFYFFRSKKYNSYVCSGANNMFNEDVKLFIESIIVILVFTAKVVYLRLPALFFTVHNVFRNICFQMRSPQKRITGSQ